jgi:hypothetical protein
MLIFPSSSHSPVLSSHRMETLAQVSLFVLVVVTSAVVARFVAPHGPAEHQTTLAKTHTEESASDPLVAQRA